MCPEIRRDVWAPAGCLFFLPPLQVVYDSRPPLPFTLKLRFSKWGGRREAWAPPAFLSSFPNTYLNTYTVLLLLPASG
jgi:hypothetical protein